MALPVLPADGDNPWGAALRSALTDISNRADSGILQASNAQLELDGVHDQLDTNTSQLATNTTQLATNTTALSTKADDSSVVKLTGNQTIAGIKTFSSNPSVPDNAFAIAKTSGLQTALNAKAPLASPTFTGTVAGITKAMVGLANVDNTTDVNKPVSTATQTALDLKANGSDLTTQIQTHNHTGGINGVNVPIAAVTGLQTQLNTLTTGVASKQNTITSFASGSSQWTLDTGNFTQDYVWFFRWGRLAMVNFRVVTKIVINGGGTGNIGNKHIATINSSSVFSDIYPGSIHATFYPLGIPYHLSSVDTGGVGDAYISPDGAVYLSAVGPGQTLAIGTTLTFHGMFILNNDVI